MKTSELMTRNPATCRATDTLERAAQLMCDCDIGYVPVVDDKGELCGVVTDRDICMAALSCGKSLRELPVSQAMSCVLVTAAEDEQIEAVEARMRDRQIRRIPVVDASCHPVGVVSVTDLALAYQRARLSATDVAATLAAICQPPDAPLAGRDAVA